MFARVFYVHHFKTVPTVSTAQTRNIKASTNVLWDIILFIRRFVLVVSKGLMLGVYVIFNALFSNYWRYDTTTAHSINTAIF